VDRELGAGDDRVQWSTAQDILPAYELVRPALEPDQITRLGANPHGQYLAGAAPKPSELFSSNPSSPKLLWPEARRGMRMEMVMPHMLQTFEVAKPPIRHPRSNSK
jgi:hypothetical protein